jgi:hypothetical protein
MLSLREALVVVGCISIGFIVSAGPGFAARSSEPEQWIGSVRPEVRSAALEASAQRRIDQLEQQVKELELQQRAALASDEDQSLELAAAKARSEELADRILSLTLENQDLGQSRSFERAICVAPDDADPRAQLRFWARQMRDGESGFRAGFPPEWDAALNLLIKRDRSLDPQNPWLQQ